MLPEHTQHSPGKSKGEGGEIGIYASSSFSSYRTYFSLEGETTDNFPPSSVYCIPKGGRKRKCAFLPGKKGNRKKSFLSLSLLFGGREMLCCVVCVGIGGEEARSEEEERPRPTGVGGGEGGGNLAERSWRRRSWRRRRRRLVFLSVSLCRREGKTAS